MDIKIITVGNVKEAFYRNKITEYMDFLNKRCNVRLIELKDESIPQNAGESIMKSIKETEGEKILECIGKRDYVIALCIDGKKTSGEELGRQIKKAGSACAEGVALIIGGSLGLSEKVVKRANYRMSFSDMTFPHQLMRVMLLAELKKVLT